MPIARHPLSRRRAGGSVACRQAPGAALILLGLAIFGLTAGRPTIAQVVPYNPYADSQDPTPPVLPDGTIHWGTFYKSAAMQKAYERLWNLGACRNTNKAITIPVENNRLTIDSLPDSRFRGVVKAVAGGNSGGMVAFVLAPADGAAARECVALLHPAGVSRVDVSGTAPVSFLAKGMMVRFQTTVDARGRTRTPLDVIHVIDPATDAKPAAVTADREELVVGRVISIQRGVLSVRVDAGRIRKLTIPLADGVEVRVATTQVALAGPGDTVEIEGRLWTGEGSLGDGSVFADRLTVVKHGPTGGETKPKARAGDLGAR